MPFVVGHDESFPHAGIDHEDPITPQTIPAPGTTYQRELERLACHGWIGKDVRAALADNRRGVLGRLLNRTAELSKRRVIFSS